MTEWLSGLHLVGTCTEEDHSTLPMLLTHCSFARRPGSRWICDCHHLAGVLYHGSVSQFWYVNVAIRAHEFFERTAVKPGRPNASVDPNVYENRRFVASTSFERIERVDKLLSRIAPTPVSERKERNRFVFRHTASQS